MFCWRISATDVDQAYVQSPYRWGRVVYMRPPPELGLGPKVLLKLNRPIYGLADAGDHWYHSLERFIREELGLESVTVDVSLHKHHDAQTGTCGGLVATYVDDTLIAGDKTFEKKVAQIGELFDTKPTSYDDLTFAGMQLATTDYGFFASQTRAAAKLRPLPTEATYSEFKSRLMAAAWTVHTRPDVAFAVASLAQVTETMYTRHKRLHLDSLNKTIKQLTDEPNLGIRFPRLDFKTLELRVYTDGSFANNADGTSQFGHVILLADATGKCAVISYRSYTCRRRVRSVLGSETLAFVDGFDQAYLVREQLRAIFARRIPLKIFMDSKTLFDVLTRGTLTTERRLVIDLMVAREAYERGEISDVGHVRSEHNLEDELTKVIEPRRLRSLMRTGRYDHPVSEWVIRSATTTRKANAENAERLAFLRYDHGRPRTRKAGGASKADKSAKGASRQATTRAETRNSPSSDGRARRTSDKAGSTRQPST